MLTQAPCSSSTCRTGTDGLVLGVGASVRIRVSVRFSVRVRPAVYWVVVVVVLDFKALCVISSAWAGRSFCGSQP